MKAFFFFFFLLTMVQSYSQTDTVFSYEWKGPCCDAYGKPANPADFSNMVYHVKKFKSKIPVELHIKAITLGSTVIPVNVYHKAKIEGDTEIISINDSIGVKLVVGKVVENGFRKYLYKLILFEKDKASNCWRPANIFTSMFDVYGPMMSINGYGSGVKGQDGYIEISEGWIKFD